MRVLLDTNVVLDVILQRAAWFADSEAVWNAHHQRRIEAFLVATTITNIFYLARREIGRDKARLAVGLCLATFNVLPVTKAELINADAIQGSDLGDNLVIACATLAGLDAIVTRDASGFTTSTIPVLSPAQLLAKLTP